MSLYRALRELASDAQAPLRVSRHPIPSCPGLTETRPAVEGDLHVIRRGWGCGYFGARFRDCSLNTILSAIVD